MILLPVLHVSIKLIARKQSFIYIEIFKFKAKIKGNARLNRTDSIIATDF